MQLSEFDKCMTSCSLLTSQCRSLKPYLMRPFDKSIRSNRNSIEDITCSSVRQGSFPKPALFLRLHNEKKVHRRETQPRVIIHDVKNLHNSSPRAGLSNAPLVLPQLLHHNHRGSAGGVGAEPVLLARRTLSTGSAYTPCSQGPLS